MVNLNSTHKVHMKIILKEIEPIIHKYEGKICIFVWAYKNALAYFYKVVGKI